jgi:hypothetical protein
VTFAGTAVADAGAAALGPYLSSGTLSAALGPVLEQLVAACAVGDEPRWLEVKMACRLTTGSDGEGLPVELPVALLRLDRDEAAGAAAALARGANAWFDATAPSLAGAELQLACQVSAEVAGESVPLIRLPEVRYTVPPGWWRLEADRA